MSLSLLLAGTLWLSQAQVAAPPNPAKEAASPMATALGSANLTYTELPAFYKLPFTLAGERKQQVYIRKSAEIYNSVRVNEVFSICYEAESEPSLEVLHKTFLRRFTIGGLVLEAPSAVQPKWRMRFRLELAQGELPERLTKLLSVVAATADLLEKELAGGVGDKL